MKIKNNHKKHIVILGAGESGTGAAILAKKMGHDVFVSDKNVIKNKYRKILIKQKIKFEEKKHTLNKILCADEIIKSPGIDEKNQLIKTLRTNKYKIISEIEFASRYTNAKLICITGSNGKTTTTNLTYHILKKAGLDVAMAGNVNISFAKEVAKRDREYFVLEISNFQLDDMYDFKADIAILLNITPDHLDRYDYDFDRYIQSKFRIIRNQTEKDTFIYNADDEVIKNELLKRKNLPMKLVPFSIKDRVENGAYMQNQKLYFQFNHKQELIMPVENMLMQGKHNTYNALAASLVSKILFIRNLAIRESLQDFVNIEHRLEHVAKVHGIDFINDSKATNVNSVWYALECMTTPIIWIVGGQDKGNDYNMLVDLVQKKVKAIVCLGLDNRKIHNAFSRYVHMIVNTVTMEDAVSMAYNIGSKGDTVLLSPACSSFDIFDDYEDRGRKFKNEVKSL